MDRHLTWRDFEAEIVRTNSTYRGLHVADVGRYGVQVAMRDGEPMPIRSLPDFEGDSLEHGRVIFDAKVVSGASFDLAPYHVETKGPRSRQYEFMRRRSQYGARCGFLVHFNPRSSARIEEPGVTLWLPIVAGDPWWMAFERWERRRVNRDEVLEIGRVVSWVVPPGAKKERCDFLGVWDDQ